jgi:hypothetical protein
LNPFPKFFTKVANRLIQDVIEYTDREDDDGIIIFLDQQKAFDRVEWGWVDHVLSKFNFGENLGIGFKCYSNMHKLVSRPMVLCLNISIFQGPVDKGLFHIWLKYQKIF